jgi:hypothetical protein
VLRQTGSGAAGRRASLTDTVRDWLFARTLPLTCRVRRSWNSASDTWAG